MISSRFLARFLNQTSSKLAFKTRARVAGKAIAVLALFPISINSAVHAATYTVTSSADTNAVGTLRWAIEQANSNPGQSDQIVFDPMVGPTITLTSNLPTINKNSGSELIIQGNGVNHFYIHGNQSHQVFFVESGQVSISDLTISGGKSTGGNGGKGFGGGGGGLGAGGGIFVNTGAEVTVKNVDFYANNATGGNGGNSVINGPLFGGGGGGLRGENGDNANLFSSGAGNGGGGRGSNNLSRGRDGSFGGGGGGGGLAGVVAGPGEGGFGAGDGGVAPYGGGNGGSGLGGAIFVREGGSLTIIDSSVSASSVTAGLGGYDSLFDNQSANGEALGAGMYLHNQNVTFKPTTGVFSVLSSQISGTGGIIKKGDGELIISAINDYSGDTDLDAGTLQLFGQTSTIGTGTLQANGGTLKFASIGPASQTFTNDVSLNEDLTVIVNSGITQNFNGVFSGEGDLIFTGAGNSVLNGHNTFTGLLDLQLSDSKVTLGSSSALAAGTDVNIGANSTLASAHALNLGELTGSGSLQLSGVNTHRIGSDDDFTFDGTVKGSFVYGTIVKQGSGSMTVTNTSGAFGRGLQLGNVLVEEGELIGATNTFGTTFLTTGEHGSLVFDQDFDANLSHVVAGNGTFVKRGDGRLNLNSLFGHGGDIVVESGNLAVNTSVGLGNNSTIFVGENGTLSGTGLILNNVSNSGTVAAGNSIGILAILGDYENLAGSTVEVEINSAGNIPGINNDLIAVTGEAIIQGGTVAVKADPGAYQAGDSYIFLAALGGVTGTFDDITDDLALYRAILQYGNDYVGFTLAREKNFANIGLTPNQIAVGEYLDFLEDDATGALQTTIDSLALSTDTQILAALNQFQGQIYATLASSTIQQTSQNLTILRNQLALNEACLNGTGELGWIRGYGQGGRNSGDFNSFGYQSQVGGTEFAYQKCLGEGFSVGGFGNFGWSNVRLTEVDEKASVDNYQFGLSSQYVGEYAYVLGVLGMGIQGYDVNRNLSIPNATGPANASFNGYQQFNYSEVGTRISGRFVDVNPYIALQNINTWQESAFESGPTAVNLHVDSTQMHSLRSIVGTAFEVKVPNSGFSMPIRMGWMHEYADTVNYVNSSFIGAGGPGFKISGADTGRDFGVYGIGLQYAVADQFKVFGGYDVQTNWRETYGMGSGGIQFSW